MADFFQPIIDFFQQNQIATIAIGAAVFFLIMWLRGRKARVEVISRSEVERNRRINDLILNSNEIGETVYKHLFHGKRWLGKIINLMQEKDEKQRVVYEIIFKPKWFWRFAHPTRREELRTYDDGIIKNASDGALIVLPGVSIDNYFGIHYDVPHASENQNFIKEQVYKTDAESLGDMYFAESQKRATVDLTQAGVITEKQMDLQIEREKRARLVSGGGGQ